MSLLLVAGTSDAAVQQASLPSGESAHTRTAASEPKLPAVLNAADASRYRAIFDLQADARWKQADDLLANLGDRVLVGTVLADRYLSPRYQTSFAEARDWLSRYREHPDALAIWTLAKRKSVGQNLPRPADPGSAAGAQPANSAASPTLPPEPSPASLRRPWGFTVGLAAWRARRWPDAARIFTEIARAPGTPSWYAAAAAFWAARANMMLRKPDQVDGWFETAAQQPRTFYGLLAEATLGLALRPSAEPLSDEERAALQATPGGRRALALVQIGQRDRAEAELRALSVGGNRELSEAIVALADLANMPALCAALGRPSKDESALYPVPRWQPQNGFSVDRALLFALMLEESRFKTGVYSGAGAAGLMQLMPETAKSVARSAGIPLRDVSDLVDPVLNLSLGQEYVKELIGHQQVNGNLILLLAAYNTGPGLLAKWQNHATEDDPLLFIESLPSQETRLYVQRVLTNLWIYRQRLGQDLPDLDALAANRWPTYVSMDTPAHGGVLHASAR